VIYTSDLPNDQDMIKALGSMAIPAPLFTDACFSSVDGKVIAVERKKIGDLCQCINDGRFIFQMQNCKEAGADYLVLILEGRYRRNPEDGILEIPIWLPFVNAKGQQKRREEWQPVQPTMMFSRFDQYLTELQRDVGIIVKHTENVRGTANVILALYQNFQTPQDGHQSMHQMFKPPTPTVQLVRPSLVRRVASELKGVGWNRSGDVANHFHSVSTMTGASEDDWKAIPGIGKKLARDIVAELQGRKT